MDKIDNIEKLFEEFIDNLFSENTKNIKTVDIFPKQINSNTKYAQIEKYILKSNEYNFLDKYYRALINLYVYEDNLYYQEEENLKYKIKKDNKDLKKYINLLKKGFDFNSNGVLLIFNDLKLALSISPYQLNIMFFNQLNKDFIELIFKFEGLFII
ncbi:hypothetical protein [Clostridium tarantellae]|uniref:Uncharacterized protein n=1 Tax=Clostridium tarantellae TaxID=39493 RepID=A0A6I1MWK4_9CLOT|nr:hypothetical protein [Clostridium tarantellae]MPQ45191.1 hypothetical protein [Clostridium tarantellae]